MMTLLYETTVHYYNQLEAIEDPRSRHFPLVQNPFNVIAILTFYLAFVFKFGPEMMRNREPLKIGPLVTVYNLVQIVLNMGGFIMGINEFMTHSILCTPIDWSESVSAYVTLELHYFYLVLKALDLLDTVFFVLRKNYRQITFLHVYHHVVMMFVAFMSFKYFPGGHLMYLGVPNAFVHMVMYSYYYITSKSSTQKNILWWKKHITQLQIVQHCFILVSFVLPMLNSECSYPKMLLGFYITQTVTMIYLFSKFYVEKYCNK